MKTQYFKLHSNGKVCRVVDVETNLVGGKGFDVFVKIIEPDHSGQPGWNYEMWVAVCRGEFVEVIPYPEGETSRDAAALQYWRESLLTPFDEEDAQLCYWGARKTAAWLIADGC